MNGHGKCKNLLSTPGRKPLKGLQLEVGGRKYLTGTQEKTRFRTPIKSSQRKLRNQMRDAETNTSFFPDFNMNHENEIAEFTAKIR